MKKILLILVIFGLPCTIQASMNFISTRPDWINLTGAQSYVSVSTVVTMCAWAKTTSSNSQVILSLSNLTLNNPLLNLGTGNVGAAGTAGYIFRSDGGTASQSSSVGTYNDGQWHHFCAVANGSVYTLYVDGSQQATTSAVLGPITLTTFSIGVINRTTLAQAFTGEIDDARLYNRALSLAEIFTLGKFRGRVLITSVFAGYWPMNDGFLNVATTSGTFVVSDRSGNGTTGKVQGTPTWGPTTALSYP